MPYPQQNPPDLLQRHDDREEFQRQVTEAFNLMRTNLDHAPPPRFRWDNVAAKRYNPLGVAMEMVDDAIDAGATEDQVWPLVTLVAHRIERRFPRPVLTVEAASQLETEAQSAVDPLQHQAIVTPNCESTLVALERKLVRKVRVIEALIQSIRHRLDERRANRRRRSFGVAR